MKKCENGGVRDKTGNCSCSKDFKGPTCQYIVCYNGGFNVTKSECSCSTDRYYGSHCQSTKCDNGGQDNKNGSCTCVSGWYSGKYCEIYGNSWLIMFGVAGAIVMLLLICCLIYRLGCKCSSRNDSSSRSSGSRRNRRRPTDAETNSLPEELTSSIQYQYSKPPDYRPETPPPSYELALSWSRENLDRVGTEVDETTTDVSVHTINDVKEQNLPDLT